MKEFRYRALAINDEGTESQPQGWFDFSGRPDQNRAEDWIIENSGLIWSIVHDFVSSKREADDLFQEACIIILYAFPTYDSHWVETKRSTYLAECIRNRMKEVVRGGHAKKRALYSTVSAQNMAERLNKVARDDLAMNGTIHDDDEWSYVCPSVSFEDAVLDGMACSAWLKRIAQLPAKPRMAMQLHLEGYTQMEIAQKMGKSQASVSGYLAEARGILEKYRKEAV